MSTTTTTGPVIRGTVLESTRDPGRRVKVLHEPTRPGGKYRVENVKTGRRTELSESTLAKFRIVASPVATSRQSVRRINAVKPLTNERQRELLRIIKSAFSDFHHRQQHFYLGGGISTSHVVVKTIADIKQLQLFWPEELVQRKGIFGSGNTYVLEGNVMERVQNRIRDTLKQLEEKGYIEKVGNRDERRWKPTYADGERPAS